MSDHLTGKIKSKLLVSAAGAVLSLCVASAASAQTTDENGVEEIVVTGIKATTANALATKRKADVILDGISADDLGNFPDLNLGEALQRITGVQIDREAERRDATISVRGLPGNFTKTTLMGQNISSPNRRGSNPFGVFDSSIFNGVDVEKSFSAESLAGGLAANVNLKLKSALDRRDGVVLLRAKAEYEETAEELNPGIYASGTKHFMDGKLGVYGTVSHSVQNFRRDIIRVEYDRGAPNLTEIEEDGRVDYYAGNVRQNILGSEGDRTSGVVGVEYEPTDNLSLRLDGIFTQRKLDKATDDVIQIQPRQSNRQVTSPDDGVFAGSFDLIGNDGILENVYLHQTIDFEDPQVAYGTRDVPLLSETFAIYPQLNWENDDFKVNLTGTFSKSENTTDFQQFDARIMQTAGRSSSDTRSNGVTGRFVTPGLDLTNIDWDLNVPEGTLQLGGGDYAITSGTGLSAIRFEPGVDGAQGIRNLFTVTGFAQGAVRDLNGISGDVEYKISKGPFVGLKAGGRFEDESAEVYRFENGIAGLNLDNLDNSVLIPNRGISATGTFFAGEASGFINEGFLGVDIQRIRELLLPASQDTFTSNQRLSDRTGAQSRPFTNTPQANPFTDFNQSFQNIRGGSSARTNRAISETFEAERENTELYGMVKFDFNENYDTFPVRGNFGVRYINTDLSGLAEGATEEGSASYEKFLPSVNIIADLTDDIVMQGAYYETFEAFNLAEFNPTASVISLPIVSEGDDDEEERGGTLTIQESNLGLDPRSSTAFDLGLAWYNRPGSIIGVNFFTKDVIEINTINSNGSDAACLTSLNDLSSSDAAAEAAARAAVGDGTPFVDSSGNCRLDIGRVDEFANPRLNVRQVINTDPITVNGIEFQMTQNTDFLDGFWGNFGGTVNYTHVTSDNANDEALTRVSEDTYNLIGFYETDKFSVRLAQNFRSEYLLEAGQFVGNARKVKGRSQLDLSATYNPQRSLQFKFQAFNLTNSFREEFEAVELLGRRADYDGRTYTFSVQKRF